MQSDGVSGGSERERERGKGEGWLGWDGVLVGLG